MDLSSYPVGEISDIEVSKLAGCSSSAVFAYRKRHKIPKYRSPIYEERRRRIAILRKDHTLQEIGDLEGGISRERVRQLLLDK